MQSNVKPLAIYLPQYHPIPENDMWWGKGFTEWTNVAKAKPKFPGHYQPHLPKDLGFYDLRLLEVMEAQADLAKRFGVYGFCYYHYWFGGRLLLERPLHQMLESGRPAMPYCLCWANENWSRRWDGSEMDILMEQRYSPEDDLAHIRYLIRFFKDDRYIKIAGKPVLLMYRTELHPRMNETSERWREEARKEGFPDLYLVRVENFLRDVDPAVYGFDAGMEFAPDFNCAGRKYLKQYPVKYAATKWMHRLNIQKSGYFDNQVFQYDELVENMLRKPPAGYKRFRTVCPSWDNSARRASNAVVFHKSTPEKFKSWVSDIAKYTERSFDGDEQIFFINAWNEWGEGCHLEPDQRFGLGYLEAFKAGLGGDSV
ncbi:glycosyltransferase WbsX family protein [Parapedobacter composti]|nr:glycoside hydrolase family 99-like domain-containing protein [Parapedobacter composti]